MTTHAGHLMVIRDSSPVRIGDGPTIHVISEDQALHIRVDDVPQYLPSPYPDPVPIHGTPYEAYALGAWTLDVFAIRLREQP